MDNPSEWFVCKPKRSCYKILKLSFSSIEASVIHSYLDRILSIFDFNLNVLAFDLKAKLSRFAITNLVSTVNLIVSDVKFLLFNEV